MSGRSIIPLTTEGFRDKALAIPNAIDRFLAQRPPTEEVIQQMASGDAAYQFAKKIEAETEIVNAIQYGRLKLIAYYAELHPAPTPEESGKKGGRGNTKAADNGEEKGSKGGLDPFSAPTMSAYRKVGANKDRLDEYRDEVKKTPGEEMSVPKFIRFSTGTEKAGTAAHVSENTGIPEWYTPPKYIAAARKVLGKIDLDPASSEIAQKTVKAVTYYTIEDDGLAKDWRGRVFMNPPYSADLVAAFVNKLCDHVETGDVPEAILLVNNATETRWLQRALQLASSVCFPEGRIKFLDENGNPGAPLQGQVFLYFGSRDKTFVATFLDFGAVLLNRSYCNE